MSGAALPTSVEGGASKTASPLVSLIDVEKTFPNGTTALTDLNLDVGRGEFLTLLGPSGCGKSTALRMIAGLATPSSGEILWGKASTDHVRPEIGFVFQEPTLTPWSNVFDNVWLPLRLRGVSRRAASDQIEEALKLVSLENFAGAMPRELSGGMKMRVSIARALVLRPTLLLMDEPFAALDEITRFKLNEDLLQVKASLGATVVFVTHSVFESVFLSSRIVIFAARPGRIVDALEIDAAAIRDKNFRVTERYASLCRDASQRLEAAMALEGQQRGEKRAP